MLLTFTAYVQAADPVPEEITVTNTTLKSLRADLVIAEDRMHEIFNSLVDDEFKIICEDVAITGTLIKQRLCEPNFRRQAKIKDFRDAKDGGANRIRSIRSSKALDRDLAEKSEKMLQLTAELAQDNPELLQSLVEVLSLRNEIESRGGEP